MRLSLGNEWWSRKSLIKSNSSNARWHSFHILIVHLIRVQLFALQWVIENDIKSERPPRITKVSQIWEELCGSSKIFADRDEQMGVLSWETNEQSPESRHDYDKRKEQ